MGENTKPFTVYPEDWEIMATLTSEEKGVLVELLATESAELLEHVERYSCAVHTAYVAVRILHRLIPDEG